MAVRIIVYNTSDLMTRVIRISCVSLRRRRRSLAVKDAAATSVMIIMELFMGCGDPSLYVSSNHSLPKYETFVRFLI